GALVWRCARWSGASSASSLGLWRRPSGCRLSRMDSDRTRILKPKEQLAINSVTLLEPGFFTKTKIYDKSIEKYRSYHLYF
ncbi:MAG: hypothetical protein SWJ54_15240, partial [Cyanobacteriota bacterium]|nr:hypothetical protein [Cyanobacteriota bacterium]